MVSTLYRADTRTRGETVLGRAWAYTVRQAPGMGRWLARTGRRYRQLLLYVAGLGSLVWAAFLWAAIAGFVALGVSLLVLEWLSAPEAPR